MLLAIWPSINRSNLAISKQRYIISEIRFFSLVLFYSVKIAIADQFNQEKRKPDYSETINFADHVASC